MRIIFLSRVYNEIWKSITLEPTLALYVIVFELLTFTETNLLLQKSCRSDRETGEPDLSTGCDDEKYGQQFAAVSNSWRYTLSFCTNVFVTTAISVWIDKTSNDRRWMIYGPVVGQLLQCLYGSINSYFWTWNPNILSSGSALILGLSGGKLCAMLGSQLYISSITGNAERTARIGVITSVHYICLPISNGLAGYLNAYLGFAKSFLFCALLMVLALLSACWKITPSPENHRRQQKVDRSKLINPLMALKSMSKVFGKRSKNKRLTLICLMITDSLVLIPLLGEQTVTYLYFRYRFGWQEKAYSVYTAYKMLGTLFGTMFCTVYMSKYLKIHDGFIGTLAAFWDTVGNISYFFADQTWELYVIPLYNIFNGVLFAMMASLSTKCVEPNEMGYLTSVRSLMQIISPLSFPLYGLVYRSTLDVLPQAFFLLSVLFNFPTIILFGIAYYYSKDIIFDTQQDTVQSTIDNNPVGTDNVTDDTSPSAVENGRVKKPDELQ